MLLPALSKARMKARSISCVNNVKQLKLAEQMYEQDTEDFMMPAAAMGYYWGHILQKNNYLAGQQNTRLAEFICPEKANQVAKSSSATYSFPHTDAGVSYQYGLNSMIHKINDRLKKVEQLKYPSETSSIGDSRQYTETGDSYHFDNSESLSKFMFRLDFPHNGQIYSSVGFADGHVSSVKQTPIHLDYILSLTQPFWAYGYGTYKDKSWNY